MQTDDLFHHKIKSKKKNENENKERKSTQNIESIKNNQLMQTDNTYSS